MPEPDPEPEPDPMPKPDPEPAPLGDSPTAAASEPAPGPEPEPEPETGAAPAAQAAATGDGGAGADDGWISPESAQQATASLQQLAEASRKEEFGGGAMSENDKLLENMVREALRPQVKEWLDQNLPGLVERIVREEVRRMTRKAEAAADEGDDADAY
jgi:hypothetical protein